jgi:hypothetical protein
VILAERERAGLLDTTVRRDGYVFSPAPDCSTRTSPNTVTQRYSRLAARLGVDTHLHSLRHYSATELIAAGVDIRTVAGRLGHAGGGSTTLRTYRPSCSKRISEPPRRLRDVVRSQLNNRLGWRIVKALPCERGSTVLFGADEGAFNWSACRVVQSRRGPCQAREAFLLPRRNSRRLLVRQGLHSHHRYRADGDSVSTPDRRSRACRRWLGSRSTRTRQSWVGHRSGCIVVWRSFPP